MRVHMIGVSGAGMGSLAALFREQGHVVTGSDVAFDPPVGPALLGIGVECKKGWTPENLLPDPDLVVVGNAIRKDNAEAVSAAERGLARSSMSKALREHFLIGRRALVVCGTHGKTTTSSMAAWMLHKAGKEPGWFIGGVPKDLPGGAAIGQTKRKVVGSKTEAAPFVVEGDEYDDVYWSKRPKFLDYVGVGHDDVVILTSVEHDHIDIYPDPAKYEDAFREMVRAIPPGGLLVCDARSERARILVQEEAKCRVSFYALEGDATGDVTPSWLGALAPNGQFDLFAGGMACGRFAMRVPGAHNVRNAIAAIAACAEGLGVDVKGTRAALATFEGVKRRQDLIGEPGGVHVYDDFAHHPTAVDETLRALKAKHPDGALWAIFEPRSATACRSLHQAEYAEAFGAADQVILAPLGRSNIAEGERLDLEKLARALGAKAAAMESVDAIVARVGDATGAKPGDTVAVLSNGAFGGLHAKLLAKLGSR